jgi:hypothetical protein
MTKPIAIISIIFVSQIQLLPAQAETAHHREVYAEINKNADTYKRVTAKEETEHASVDLSGWTDGGALRKIVATVNGEHGTGSEEYYIEDGRPLFVYTVYNTEDPGTGKVVARVEDRYYFKGDAMIKWLSGKEEPFEPGSRDFKMIAESVHADALRYIAILGKKAGAEPVAAAQYATGVFKGIEEGDYFHWQITGKDGTEVSYFILKPDATMQKALDDPKAFIGRKCRVKYLTSVEDIPEAGGKMEITRITGVEWIE